MVKWLHENVIPADPDATSSVVLTAARLGSLEMLEWVLKIEKTRHWRTDELLTWAAWFGHRNILEWANAHLDATLSPVMMNGAVSGGQVDLAQWLLREGLNSLSVAAFTDAVSSKRSEMIDWVFNNLVIPVNDFGPISDYVLASKGMLGVLQKLGRIDVKFSIVAMDSAAANGHLDVVEWLHEHQQGGCTTAAMDGAAANKHLNVVQWLQVNRTEGCTTDAMDQASTNGHLEVVQWLHNHRTEGCTVKAIDGAAANGHLAVVKWLHSHRSEGCTAAAMDGAVQHGHLEVLTFLLENYIDGYSEGAIDIAARSGHLEIVKWLHVQQAEEISPKTIKEAAKGGCTEVLVWLLQHYDRGADNSGEKLFMQMVCPLESAIMLYSDGRFAWEEGAIRSGFVSRDVEVSCWMWSIRPEDMRPTMESTRDLVSRKWDEFEKIQDSIAPGWRAWMVNEGPKT